MKKTIFLITSILLLICGCSTNSNLIICTGNYEYKNYKANMKAVGTLTDNKISKVSVTMTLDSEDLASTFCNFFAMSNSMAESNSDKIDYKCDKNEITINNFDLMAESEEEKVIGTSKANFIKAMREENLTCK